MFLTDNSFIVLWNLKSKVDATISFTVGTQMQGQFACCALSHVIQRVVTRIAISIEKGIMKLTLPTDLILFKYHKYSIYTDRDTKGVPAFNL